MGKSVLFGLIAMLGASSAQAMPLTGQTVSASFTPLPGFSTVITPFANPAVVGPAVEFTGEYKFDFVPQTWGVSLDIGADTFTVHITSELDAALAAGIPPLTISVTGFSGLGPVTFQSYSCAPPGAFSCYFVSEQDVDSVSSDATSVTIALHALRVGASYVFAAAPVPEPASLALVLGGLPLIVSLRRRGKSLGKERP